MTSLAADQESILYVRTVEIPDIPNLLALLPADGGLAWINGLATNQMGIVGWGEVTRSSFHGPERFSRAQRWWSQQCATSIIPEVAIIRNQTGTRLTITSDVAISDAQLAGVLSDINRPRVVSQGINNVTWLPGSRTVSEWQSAVDSAVARINAGELDKVVLARDIVAQLDEPIHIGALLIRLNESFPECWTFCVDGLVGATPELLIRRDGEHVTSRVLAGTMRRSRDTDRDGQLAAELLDSDKDQEEHVYAVESVAAALATHCTHVIKELEGMDSGRYSAPVGWLAANGNGEFGIALRCALVETDDRKTLRLFAGCGIVAGSTGESEVAESQAKFAAMKSALE